MSRREDERTIIAEVIVGAWGDDAFRTRLLDDPVDVLTDAGLTLPADCRVTVLEDTPAVTHLAIPCLEDLVAGEKERFMAELATLLPLPAGVELRLFQDTPEQRFVVLPLPHPPAERLSDEDMETIVGGGNGGNGGTGGLWGDGGCGVVGFGNGGAGGNGGTGGLGVPI